MPKGIKPTLEITLEETNKVMVYGPIADKRLCLFLLTEAIRIVYDYKPPKIIEPDIHIVKPNG